MRKNSRKCHLGFTLCLLRGENLICLFWVAHSYTDPVDGSTASKQGLILSFKYANGDPARVVFRLSGTGSAGATIRVYLEKFEPKDYDQAAPTALQSLAERAIELVKMEELTGRDAPTVIT